MDLPFENIDGFLRTNFGENVLCTFRITKKLYRRYQSILLDIKFLKNCRSYNVIPKFLWFKTANNDLASSYIYKDCQRRLLNVQIDTKYKDLRKAKNHYNLSVDSLRTCTSDVLFAHLQKVIIKISITLLKEKEEKMSKKLLAYDLCNQGCQTYPILGYSPPFHHFVPQKILYPWGTYFVPHLGL
jgi:hypothetical protein